MKSFLLSASLFCACLFLVIGTVTPVEAVSTQTAVHVVRLKTDGQPKTPGLHRAPPNNASWTVDVTLKGTGLLATNDPTFTLRVTAGANGSKVCRDIDTGQPHTWTRTSKNGTYTEIATDTCSGTYQDGRLTYTETVTSDQAAFTSGALKGAVCTVQKPYVVNHMEGTFTSPTDINGTFSSDGFNGTCVLGTRSTQISYPGERGTWTGHAHM